MEAEPRIGLEGGWGLVTGKGVKEGSGDQGQEGSGRMGVGEVSWGLILRWLEMVDATRSGEGRRQPFMLLSKVKGREILGGFLGSLSHMSRSGVRGHRRSLAARVAQRMYLRSSSGSVEDTISRAGRLTFFWAPSETRRQDFWNLSRMDSVERGAVERTSEPNSMIGLIQVL